jgi:hypothetical protein
MVARPRRSLKNGKWGLILGQLAIYSETKSRLLFRLLSSDWLFRHSHSTKSKRRGHLRSAPTTAQPAGGNKRTPASGSRPHSPTPTGGTKLPNTSRKLLYIRLRNPRGGGVSDSKFRPAVRKCRESRQLVFDGAVSSQLDEGWP